MAETNQFKSILFFVIKLLIAGIVVWYLLLRNPGEIWACLAHIEVKFILAAGGVYLLHMLCAAWRWGRLARILGVKLSAFESLSLTMQGYFFSLVIPGGAIGGDVVKMGVLSRRSASGEKFEGVFSILMDRIIGMISLFTMALVLIPLNYKNLSRVRVPGFPEAFSRYLIGALVLLCLGGLAASCVIFLHRIIRKVPLFNRGMELGDKLTHGMVQRMTDAADVYARNRKELIFLLLASVLGIHLMTALPVCLLLYGMGISCRVLTVICALTIGNIIGLIPLFPAGVGGRDVAAVMILAAAGIPEADAKTAQLIYTALLLVISLAAGLFFVFDRGRVK